MANVVFPAPFGPAMIRISYASWPISGTNVAKIQRGLPRLGRRLGEILHLQAVVVVAPLAAREHLLRNLIDGQIRIPVWLPAECGAQHE